MKIQNHDEFPKLDHRTAPSFWAERDWVVDSPPVPRVALGTGGTINWGIFKRHFWGELLRHPQRQDRVRATRVRSRNALADDHALGCRGPLAFCLIAIMPPD